MFAQKKHCCLKYFSAFDKNSANGLKKFWVENAKKLYHASLLTHGLLTRFNDFTATLRLTPTHNSRLILRKHTKRPVVLKHVEQCHIWGDKTRAAYIFVKLQCKILTYVKQYSIHRSRATYLLWEEKDK